MGWLIENKEIILVGVSVKYTYTTEVNSFLNQLAILCIHQNSENFGYLLVNNNVDI